MRYILTEDVTVVLKRWGLDYHVTSSMPLQFYRFRPKAGLRIFPGSRLHLRICKNTGFQGLLTG